MNVLGVTHAVGKVDVQAGGRLLARVVIELVNRQGEDRWISGENGGGTVPVMHVAIHHHGAADRAIALQAPNGYCNIVDGAKTLAVIRVGMMKPASYVEPDSGLKRQARSQNRAACRQKERLRHLFRV